MSQASAIPARPASTPKTLETASCAPLGSTSGGATGSSQFEIGVQNGANWIQPPNVASTASTPTVEAMETPTTSFLSAWKCSRTNAEGSPQKTTKSIRNVYRPVRAAPTIPTIQRTYPYVPAAREPARIESFEKKPEKGGIPTSASEPARKAMYVRGR